MSSFVLIHSSGLQKYAGIETNECLENNGGCWQDKQANITACKVRCEQNLAYVTIHFFDMHGVYFSIEF